MKQTPLHIADSQRRRSRTTRWLHLLLAAVIVHQMIMSAVMQVPNAQHHRLGNVWWKFHEYGGLGSFVILLLFWIWSVRRSASETGFGDWFPWFSVEKRAALWRDIGTYVRAARRLHLPAPGTTTPLAAMVQGLGLLLVSFMATSGTLTWISFNLGGDWPSRLHWIKQLHGELGNVVWYYLALHAGAAIAHECFGHRVLKPMAPLDDQSPTGPWG